MKYEYKLVQLPQTYLLRKDKGFEIAESLQAIIGEGAVKGWEFYRIDSVGVAVKPGCLGALLGQKQTLTYYNVMSFRREAASQT